MTQASPDLQAVAAARPKADPPEADPPERNAWLELFFDLVFVVVIAQVTHRVTGDPTVGAMAGSFGLLVLVWTAWFNEAAATNVSHAVSSWRRLCVLGAMAAAGVMAVGVAQWDEGGVRLFALGYALTRLALSPIWVAERASRRLGLARAIVFGPGLASGWVLSLAVPRVTHWVWVALVLAEVLMSRDRGRGGPTKPRALVFQAGHMLDRLGAFTMICFGESVAQIVGSLSQHHGTGAWVVAGCGFVLVAAMFWQYYDVTLDRIEHAVTDAQASIGDYLGVSQLLVIAGVLGVAAGVSGGIEQVDVGHLTPGGLRVLAGGVAIFFVGASSLSMEAMKQLVVAAGISTAAGRPEAGEGRRRLSVLGLGVYLMLRALLVPFLMVRYGAHLRPWVVISLLAIAPLASLAGVSLPRRRPAPGGPAHDNAPSERQEVS